ncbi:histidinol-phosphate transaminase [Alicyclobacillus ferrooxydans]|uniref:histidinol-phosphate transaminase n=1 Tax=Alicyclobacillus ferrooxydans TaxID=471514 RepID=A0A0P9D8D2_9BACL|nr:histidinol-phosphate transaminase [Alicyclobacillus ferrooxydans]KPV45552.1 histidinol-phosphate aminotransferase [Alicyclobacillus ferrooxydans]
MAANHLRFSKVIDALPATVPFVAPEALERQSGKPIELRLGANESPFGISPKAMEAIRAEAAMGNFYGDPESLELRTALAAKHGISLNQMAVGSGIDEILGWITRAFLDPGDTVVTSLGGYPTFNYHVTSFGGKLHFVPYTAEWKNDLAGLSQAARETHARLVYLANPDNPTGTFYSAQAVMEFIESLPKDAVLILDEAYIEFADQSEVLPLSPVMDRVIRLRTFSKAYGMAGLRIGYAISGPEIIAVFDKFRNHFGVNRVAQAGALAALEDTEFLEMVVEQTRVGRADLAMAAERHGHFAIPSSTNFLLTHVGSDARSSQMVDELLVRGVFIRKPGILPLSECIRITIGTPTQHAKLLRALDEVW